MKAMLTEFEDFPVYGVDVDIYAGATHVIEVDEQTLERWRKIFKDADDLQSELEEIWNNHPDTRL